MAGSEPPLDLLRPRGVGELIATTLGLFRRHSGLFLSVSLLVVAPAVVLVDGVWGRALREGPHAHASQAASSTLALLTTLVIPPLVTALHAVIVRELGAGRVPGRMEALRAAAPRFPSAIAAVALYTLGVTVGLVLLIVPGIWLGVRWYFAAQAAVLDGVPARVALERSAALVDGRWGAAAGALVAGMLAFGLAGVVAGMLAGLVTQPVAYVSLTTVIQAVALSLSALYGTLLFFALRAAREAPLAAVP